ncbi:hypothetical protein [Thermodesulfatator autotrophicus]|uniref:Uncharacterized protein n=1 Tax=Thermodesulfatator autotrophicus TaxID=1795632 RepID=A0A177E835_9BACT|nr:hypothetical protein [Thermodesulfatator autotrophicus]OAG27948.1 hypothetical protein TH606_04220 [Thermodesulfatator autotrophicus]
MKRILIFLLMGLVLFSCARPKDLSIYPPIKKIAVLPFEPVCPGQKEDEITCAFAGKITPDNQVSVEAAQKLTELLYQYLADKPHIYLVPENQALSLWAEVLSLHTGASAYKLIAEIGKRLGVDAVLYGKVFRFREREGTAFSVVKPASVAFALILVKVPEGKVIWRGWFDETQKPLSENILKIKLYGKIRWLTAEELAERGLKQVLAKFPYLNPPKE